jgi:hypothetical protein
MTITSEQKEETPKLISKEEYAQDIKSRWKIVAKEFKDFMVDVKKLVDFIKPYVVKAVDKVKEIYGQVKAKFKK